MSDTYSEFEAAILPGWLRGKTWATRWARAMGDVKDAIAELVTEAVKARYSRYAPSDGLRYLGRVRGMERGPSEPEYAYRRRLAKPFSRAEWHGTDKGLVDALALVGFTARIFRNKQVRLKTGPGAWAHFWVVIDPPHGLVSSLRWGVGHTWGSGKKWGGEGIDPRVIAWAKREIKQIKASHAKAVEMIFVGSSTGFLWGEGKKWGAGWKWGGVKSVRVRLGA